MLNTDTVGKISTDESIQNFSRYWVVPSTSSTGVFWRPNSHSPKKFAVSTAELFVLTISTNLSRSANTVARENRNLAPVRPASGILKDITVCNQQELYDQHAPNLANSFVRRSRLLSQVSPRDPPDPCRTYRHLSCCFLSNTYLSIRAENTGCAERFLHDTKVFGR